VCLVGVAEAHRSCYCCSFGGYKGNIGPACYKDLKSKGGSNGYIRRAIGVSVSRSNLLSIAT